MRNDLHIGTREVPRKTLATGADPKLAFGQVDQLQPSLQRQPKRAVTAVRKHAVAIKLARAARRQHQTRAAEQDETVWIGLATVFGSDRQNARDAAF